MRISERLRARCARAGENAPVVIACIGDSVTHGCFEVYINHRGEIDTRYEPDSGYVAKLKRGIDILYPAAAVSVLNAGVSGGSASAGALRLERDVLSHKPDLVTVCFGLNDAMCEDVERGMASYRAAMDDMVTRILASGAECIVLTANHMCSYVASGVTDPLLARIAEQAAGVQTQGILAGYMQVAREVAKAHGAAIADAFAVWEGLAASGVDTTALLSNDINHPTREAHGIFVSELLRAMLLPAR